MRQDCFGLHILSLPLRRCQPLSRRHGHTKQPGSCGGWHHCLCYHQRPGCWVLRSAGFLSISFWHISCFGVITLGNLLVSLYVLVPESFVMFPNDHLAYHLSILAGLCYPEPPENLQQVVVSPRNRERAQKLRESFPDLLRIASRRLVWERGLYVPTLMGLRYQLIKFLIVRQGK